MVVWRGGRARARRTMSRGYVHVDGSVCCANNDARRCAFRTRYAAAFTAACEGNGAHRGALFSQACRCGACTEAPHNRAARRVHETSASGRVDSTPHPDAQEVRRPARVVHCTRRDRCRHAPLALRFPRRSARSAAARARPLHLIHGLRRRPAGVRVRVRVGGRVEVLQTRIE